MNYKTGLVKDVKWVNEKDHICLLTVSGDFAGDAGQFYLLRAWEEEPFLSRPISIHDREDDLIRFLFQVKGRGTALLSQLKEGDPIRLLGPLGNGFPVKETYRNVAVIGGGIGTAPLYYLLKECKRKNVRADYYAGFKTEPYLWEQYEKVAESALIATESGAFGKKGFVTEILPQEKDYDAVYLCGPEIMMKNVAAVFSDSVPVYVSMEKRMACGIGACIGCTIKTVNGYQRVCKDGPVFLREDVIFDA